MDTIARPDDAARVGLELLDDPILDKGTAFTAEERRKHGLEGLLPPTVETIERQLERVMGHLEQKPNDLERADARGPVIPRPARGPAGVGGRGRQPGRRVRRRGQCGVSRRVYPFRGLEGDRRDQAAVAPRRAHLDKSLARYRKAREGLDELAVGKAGGVMHPQFVARTLSELASEDAVITYDVGTPSIWVARYMHMNGKRRLIGSLNHGSMANALPQAIGAQATYPDRQVISFSGDGGFAMLMGDLLTLVQQKLAVKVVVLNNGTLGFVEMEMMAAGYLDTGVKLTNPDFAAMARGASIFARRVEDPVELKGAMAEMLAHDGPALLDVVSARMELAMPPKIGVAQATGFGLWLARAVINGRGTEIVDVAHTNLIH